MRFFEVWFFFFCRFGSWSPLLWGEIAARGFFRSRGDFSRTEKDVHTRVILGTRDIPGFLRFSRRSGVYTKLQHITSQQSIAQRVAWRCVAWRAPLFPFLSFPPYSRFKCLIPTCDSLSTRAQSSGIGSVYPTV